MSKEYILKKSADLRNSGARRNETPVSLPGKEDMIPAPITFTLNNTAVGDADPTGNAKLYSVGWSNQVALGFTEINFSDPDIISDSQTVAGLADYVGDGSFLIESISYKTSSDDSQFTQLFKYYTASPGKGSFESLATTISESYDPKNYDANIRKVNLTDRKLALNKLSQFGVSVLGGQQVQLTFRFSGVRDITSV